MKLKSHFYINKNRNFYFKQSFIKGNFKEHTLKSRLCFKLSKGKSEVPKELMEKLMEMGKKKKAGKSKQTFSI